MKPFELAPPLEIGEWINTPGPLSLSAMRGRVVMLHASETPAFLRKRANPPEGRKDWGRFGAPCWPRPANGADRR